MRTFKLDRIFLRRFAILLKMMFPSFVSGTVFLAIYILVVNGLDQVLSYYLGIVPSKFYVALGSRSRSQFSDLAWKSVCIVLAKCLIMTTIKYASGVLYIEWRRLLCQQTNSIYFKGFAYYDVNVLRKEQIDNVDQRITQDIERTCRMFSEIFASLVISPFVIGYYTYLTFQSSGYLGPIAIYLYFIIGTVVNKFLMTPIISLVVQQEKKEGDFRFKHVAIRSNAEAIGFFNSGPLENYLTNEKLDTLLRTQQKLINWQFALNFSTNFFDYFGAVLSYLVFAMAIFSFDLYEGVGAIELSGIVSRNAFYCMYLINSFSKLIDLSSQVSDMAGTTHRVAELIEHLKKDQSSNDGKEESSGDGSNASDPAVYFSMNSVSYKAPNSLRILTNDLTFDVVKGTRLLITGESSSGKTSILRILCGLWKAETGVVSTNISRGPRFAMFLPQKPYFPTGSLRQQVVYPYRVGFIPPGPELDTAIVEALFAVRLDNLIERCGGLDGEPDGDWHDVLSPGEMQRLSVARVYFHKPTVVFFDEATSAVGTDMESRIYEKLNELGMTYVTIGHRRTLRSYHSHRLHLDGLAGWTLSEITDDVANNMKASSTDVTSSFASSKDTIHFPH